MTEQPTQEWKDRPRFLTVAEFKDLMKRVKYELRKHPRTREMPGLTEEARHFRIDF